MATPRHEGDDATAEVDASRTSFVRDALHTSLTVATQVQLVELLQRRREETQSLLTRNSTGGLDA